MKNQFYGVMVYVGSFGDDIVSFYDNRSEFDEEVEYQKDHGTSNYGQVLTRDQFIAKIADALVTNGHSMAIGNCLHGNYTAEIAEYRKSHPFTGTVHPQLTAFSEQVITVFNWENQNNIPRNTRLTIADGHTGQVLINNPKAVTAKYAEIKEA